MRVVVVGLGYVGLPLAVAAVDAGHTVVGFDIDAEYVDQIGAGRSRITDVSGDEVAAALATGRFRPTKDEADLVDFDIAIIAVPTPLANHEPDPSSMVAAATTVGRYLRPGAVVVLESTTWPGTTEQLIGPLLEEQSGLKAGVEFMLGFSPERIDPGNQTWTLRTTPKLVSGVDDASLRAITEFYQGVVATVVPVSSPSVAEMAKLLENTFRYINIALVNELAMVAEQLEINIWEVVEAAGSKPFGFMRFNPGPGVGGHCLPVDPVYLSWAVRRRLSRPLRFVELADEINSHMPEHVVLRIMELLNDAGRAVRGSRILVLGYTYKPGVADIRETPAEHVVQRLLSLGADVLLADTFLDPSDFPPAVTPATLDAATLDAVDAAVLLVDHPDFDYALFDTAAIPVLDCRGRLRGTAATPL